MLQPLNQAHEAEQILRQACNTRQSKPKWSQTKFRTKPAEQHLTWWLNKSQGYAKLKRPCAVRIKRLRNCGFTLPVLAFCFFFKKKVGEKKEGREKPSYARGESVSRAKGIHSAHTRLPRFPYGNPIATPISFHSVPPFSFFLSYW